MWLKRRGQRASGLGLGCDVRVRSTRLVMTVHYGSLNRGWLDNVLWHMSRSQVWAARLCAKLSLDINSLLKEDALK